METSKLRLDLGNAPRLRVANKAPQKFAPYGMAERILKLRLQHCRQADRKATVIRFEQPLHHLSCSVTHGTPRDQ
jgi:hypothetical protein